MEMVAHMVPLLTDRGIATSTATAVLSAAGLALVAGRLLAGYLLDRIFAPYVAVAFFLAPLAGILLLFFGSGPSVAAVATVLVGAGPGAEVDLIAFLLSRRAVTDRFRSNGRCVEEDFGRVGIEPTPCLAQTNEPAVPSALLSLWRGATIGPPKGSMPTFLERWSSNRQRRGCV